MALGHRLGVMRALMAALSPLTGQRSTGVATVRSTGGDVLLPKGRFAAPIVESTTGNKAIARDKLLFTTEDVTVDEAGVAVPVTSLLGGLRHNFPVATELRWDPELTGIEKVSSLSVATTGGLEPVGDASLRNIVAYEELTQPAAAALFAAKLRGLFPGAVVTWAGSGPAQRRGRGVWQRSDRWAIFLVVARQEGTVERGYQGLNLLDLVESYLGERGAVDGRNFSDQPTTITGAGRHSVTPTSFVYQITVETHGSVARVDTRLTDGTSGKGTAIANWDRTRYDVDVAETPAYPLLSDADYEQP